MRRAIALIPLAIAGCGFEVAGVAADAARDAARDAALDAPADATVVVHLDPQTAWEVSADNGTTWTPAALPSTGWGCTHCTRLFRTTVTGVPSAVAFRFASDNRARLRVGDMPAFEADWLANYCSDAPCCAKCCDTPANCLAGLTAEQPLDPAALALFGPGPSTLTWEIEQEEGGSGFYVEMTLTY